MRIRKDLNDVKSWEKEQSEIESTIRKISREIQIIDQLIQDYRIKQ